MENRSNVQLEEGIGDLQHQDMWMAVVVDNEDTFNCTSHSKVFIVIL